MSRERKPNNPTNSINNKYAQDYLYHQHEESNKPVLREPLTAGAAKDKEISRYHGGANNESFFEFHTFPPAYAERVAYHAIRMV